MPRRRPAPPAPPSEPLADAAASFLRDLRAEQKADRTLELYGQSIRFFSQWLSDKHGIAEPTLDDLTRDNVRDWMIHLSGIQATNTVGARFRGLRRFCRWLAREGFLPESPMATLQQPTAESAPVPVLTDEQLAAVIKTAATGTGFYARRNEALIRLMIDSGLRRAEAAYIELGHLDLDQQVVLVVGKGRRPRIAPFGDKTARALDRYLRERRHHRHAATRHRPRPGYPEPESAALWLSQRGPMSDDGLSTLVEDIGRAAGIPLHAHQFRHSFAHRWLSEGGSERDLMRLVGWRSTAMLDVYGRSAAEHRAREAYRKMSLGDRL